MAKAKEATFTTMRLNTITTGGATLLTLCSASFPALCQHKQKAQKPNIILIMTDQQRFDAVGYANPVVITPNLDALAKDGVRFCNAYSSTPSSTPARAGLLTGQSPWKHGMLGYGQQAVRYPNEMPQLLLNAGYHTVGVGKMHWHPQRNPRGFETLLLDESGRVESPGFQSDYRRWFAEKAPALNPDATGIGWNDHAAGIYALPDTLHPTYWTGLAAIEEIRKSSPDKPLFLKISFARPHSPYDPPKRFLDMYANAAIPAPATGGWDSLFVGRKGAADAAFADLGDAYAINSRRHYYASVTFIDEQIGQVIQALKDKGMYDSSIIIFTSDHGDMLGDHYHWRKTYAYEGSAHIPFLVKYPKGMKATVKPGSKMDIPVELRDVLPTFLDAAGAPIPSEMDGVSLLNPIRSKKAPWRKYIDLEHTTTYEAANYWTALTDGKTKYIWFFDGREQLFDLKKDPYECNNLSSKPAHQKQLAMWRERMVEHLKERGESFVKDGKLQIRTKPLLYSPNFPKE